MSKEMFDAILENFVSWLLFFGAILGVELAVITTLLFGGLFIRSSYNSIVTYVEHKALQSFKS